MSKRSGTILTIKNPNYMKRPRVDTSSMSREQRLALARAQQNRLVYAGLRPTQMAYAGQLVRQAPQEVNFVDLGVGNYAMDTTGTVTLINTIPQGASQNQRIGKRCYLKSLLIRGFAFANTTGVINDVVHMIIYDKRPTGSLPAITDILTSTNSVSFMNDTNTNRFEVIRRSDNILIGSSTAPMATGREALTVDQFIPLKKRPMIFAAAGTGAIGDIEEGALYLVTVGNNPPGTTAATLSVAFRTRFTEQ